MTSIDNDLIDSVKVNDQVFKVGYDAYAAYDFITRISAITANVKGNVVIVNVFHKLDQVFNDRGELVSVTSDKEYLYKTIINPEKLEIRYKNSPIYEEVKVSTDLSVGQH